MLQVFLDTDILRHVTCKQQQFLFLFFFFLMLYLFFLSFLGLTATCGMLSNNGNTGFSCCGPDDTREANCPAPRVSLAHAPCQSSCKQKAHSCPCPRSGEPELLPRMTQPRNSPGRESESLSMSRVLDVQCLTPHSHCAWQKPKVVSRTSWAQGPEPCGVHGCKCPLLVGALCPRVDFPTGGFSVGNWPSKAVGVTSCSPIFFFLAYLYI